MFANEDEFRVFMVEGHRRRPRFGSVTRLALIGYGIVVPVHVARNTLLAESLIGCVGMRSKDLLNVGASDVLRRVALLALQGFMSAGEGKSGLTVIKTLLIEFRNLCISAQMFYVTGSAGTGSVLEVEAVSTGDFILDFEVAGETLLRYNLLAAAVAFRTVGNPLEVSVCNRKRSRRNLRKTELRRTDCCNEQDEP